MSETTTDARQTLLRELCEQINLWDQDAVIDDEDGLAEHWLLPVIDRYVAAELPLPLEPDARARCTHCTQPRHEHEETRKP